MPFWIPVIAVVAAASAAVAAAKYYSSSSSSSSSSSYDEEAMQRQARQDAARRHQRACADVRDALQHASSRLGWDIEPDDAEVLLAMLESDSLMRPLPSSTADVLLQQMDHYSVGTDEQHTLLAHLLVNIGGNGIPWSQLALRLNDISATGQLYDSLLALNAYVDDMEV